MITGSSKKRKNDIKSQYLALSFMLSHRAIKSSYLPLGTPTHRNPRAAVRLPALLLCAVRLRIVPDPPSVEKGTGARSSGCKSRVREATVRGATWPPLPLGQGGLARPTGACIHL